MSPEAVLKSWLRDAHATAMQAIGILENQARRFESYPDLRGRILEHLDDTRAQAEMLEGYIERHGTTPSPFKDSAIGRRLPAPVRPERPRLLQIAIPFYLALFGVAAEVARQDRLEPR